MSTYHFGSTSHAPLRKEYVADFLREEIVSGRVLPGERVIESVWANRLNVSKPTVREALNILATEGFVQKDHSRGARITRLSPEDCALIYKLRATIEGLAAREVIEKRADLEDLEQIVQDMRAALERRNFRALVERDLRFHLLLCEKSGSRILQESLKPLIIPLLGFAVIRRALDMPREALLENFAEHQRVIDLIRAGDPVRAEREVAAIIAKFAETAFHTWLAPGETEKAEVYR